MDEIALEFVTPFNFAHLSTFFKIREKGGILVDRHEWIYSIVERYRNLTNPKIFSSNQRQPQAFSSRVQSTSKIRL